MEHIQQFNTVPDALRARLASGSPGLLR